MAFPTPPPHSKRILIVDDQPEIRELVSVTLQIGPYRIETAANGEQALAAVGAALPDLILLDVMLSDNGLSGIEVLRQIKTDPSTAGAYVIMLTAKGQAHDIETARRAGADDYFVKPFSPLDLMRKVESVLAS